MFVTSEEIQDFKMSLGSYWCVWHVMRFLIFMICQDAIEVWTCDEVIDFRTLNSNANIYRVGLYDLQWQLLDMVNHVTYLLSVSCISGKIKKNC